MNKPLLASLLGLLPLATCLAQDYYADTRALWLQKAEQCKPILTFIIGKTKSTIFQNEKYIFRAR